MVYQTSTHMEARGTKIPVGEGSPKIEDYSTLKYSIYQKRHQKLFCLFRPALLRHSGHLRRQRHMDRTRRKRPIQNTNRNRLQIRYFRVRQSDNFRLSKAAQSKSYHNRRKAEFKES